MDQRTRHGTISLPFKTEALDYLTLENTMGGQFEPSDVTKLIRGYYNNPS